MTTEELLEQLEAEAQSETPVCVIDPETRTITVPPEYQLLGVENDKRVERIYFQCPKIVGDNQDLSQGYQLFINYQNANGDLDAYHIDDMSVEEDNITFSWLLEENVTKYKGSIKFAFGAIKPGDELLDPDKNRWNTTINTDCTCLVGLKCTQQVAESNPDALAQIWAAIDELKAGGGGGGGTSDYERLSNHPKINGVTLVGNKTAEELELQPKGDYLTSESDPTVPQWAKNPTKPTYTPTEVGADASGTADTKVSEHNVSEEAHNDIRLLVQGLTDRLNTLADSDDDTLDQMSEIVAYIKSNKTLIDAITTSKVSVADIVDNLTTNVANKPLSAAQGVALKALIDGITIPETLPNPQKLKFTGAVTAEYDGSTEQTVNIPESSGAEGEWEQITSITIEEDVETIYISEKDNGEPFVYTDFAVKIIKGSGKDSGLWKRIQFIDSKHVKRDIYASYTNIVKNKVILLFGILLRGMGYLSVHGYQDSANGFGLLNPVIDEQINNISIYSQGLFHVGDTVDVYGRK